MDNTLKTRVPDTVQALLDNPKPYLVPADIAKVLCISGDTIRAQAKAGMLDFPTLISGTRVRIPTIPFLRWLGYEIEIKEGSDN